MPKLTGIFSIFPDLESIPPEDIARWLKPNPGFEFIGNYLGNKLLYPETIPVTQADLAIDLAILREVIRRYPEKFQTPGKFLISNQLALRIGSILDLTLALVDVLQPKGTVQILLGDKVVGSVTVSLKEPILIKLMDKIYKFKR